MQQVAIGQHPDPHATLLRKALAAYHAIDPTRLLVGNGAIELIYLLATAYVRSGDCVVIVTPTFGEYAKAVAIMGAEIIQHPLTNRDNTFALDLDALLRTVQQTQPRMLFLCNPNNPTGTSHPWTTVETLLTAAPETLVVLDEAFVNFAPDHWHATGLREYPNLLILRSMTKDYALTALRVGYAIGVPEVITALEKVQPPWSVNAMAQAAALVALNDEGHMRGTLATLAKERHTLQRDLQERGFAPLPSAVHFFLVPVRSATDTTRFLLNRGILVRDTTSFGLPTHIRIAARQAADNAQLIAALVAFREEEE